MIEAAARTSKQAPPPHVVFEALAQPDRDPHRPWLDLLDDEQRPRILRADPPALVVWSSIWVRRPDARIRFDVLPQDGHPGTVLRFTLLVEEPLPDPSLLGHLRRRLNELINADLRFSFGQ